jgi:hypothetical protein
VWVRIDEVLKDPDLRAPEPRRHLGCFVRNEAQRKEGRKQMRHDGDDDDAECRMPSRVSRSTRRSTRAIGWLIGVEETDDRPTAENKRSGA